MNMTKQTLLQKLLEHNVPQDLYSLEGGLPNEAYCLDFVNGGWETYYSERGIKTGLKHFDDESSACSYFLEEILGTLREMKVIK
ncbi:MULTISPECIES: hypothetical protein [Microcystis]|jgi:hypothetical protein|uniref:Genome sequencing data, contig C320 n=2 Tax=Microcystis aeruginosa (strain PCC 7806) TaxID=267872 RepID=A8YJH7_MICA7|nr:MULTISPECIES: hypothetical protein [Microcystis]ARI79794.1 hypothetical protein BH695_0513 [Microcystis aeruginosa PCC 7806SL]UGS08520.1 hypothetical protein LRR78_20650 [Microcystis aeruginosa FACHB-905 = DIANCHI905]WKX63132.1 hypothetical protein Q3H53_003212 [Microcystis aeruginosa PCC 7806]CAO90824.1 unnamed protein product [Microcystis aeruginosa PCC 7806]